MTGLVSAVDGTDETNDVPGDGTCAWVDGWSPAGGWPSSVTADDRALFSRLIAASQPRNVTEARNAARTAGRFAVWAHDQGRPVDVALFDDAVIYAWADVEFDGQSSGTKGAAVGLLRRMVPGRQFATRLGAGRPQVSRLEPGKGREAAKPAFVAELADPAPAHSAAAADDPVPSLAEVTAALAGLVPEVADVLAGYEVLGLSEEWMSRVRPVALVGVAATALRRPERATAAMRAACYLAVWADTNGRRLSPGSVFSHETIEAFLAAVSGDESMVRTVATYASDLHAIRTALGLPGFTRARYRAPEAPVPYSDDELAAILDQCRRVRHARRRTFVRAAVALVAGAGAGGGEAGEVTPADVVETTGGTEVRLPGRTITVGEPWAAMLLAARVLAVRDGERWLLGGGKPLRASRVSDLCNTKGFDGVEFNVTRARYRFVLDAAMSGVYPTIPALLDACGLETLEVFENLLPAMRARQAGR